MEYINFTNIGLILDIFGVLLLFFYGFPSKISRQKPTLVVRNYTDKENKNIIKHFLLSNITIVLIIIGFVLQLLGNFKVTSNEIKNKSIENNNCIYKKSFYEKYSTCEAGKK
jgi:uncharacterized membrane protein|tara:strand:- start:934 stop:1269 length:336 start_codon:yes stop_codon:yes gene_type:complete